MTFPVFSAGEVLRAQDMNAVGLWLVKTQTIGTGVSQVDLTSVFSSEYDNYLVQVRVNSATTQAALVLQFGTGTPTATNYQSYLSTPFVAWTTGAPATVTTTSGAIISYLHPTNITGNCFVYGPNLARNTTTQGTYATDTNGGTTAGIQTSNTQFTSLHLVAGGGSFTGGTIRVYGYRN
jgi:hypothetical protein